LAIQDLSPAGAQPMASASGRFVIAFNGEIYNFRQLRAELEKEGCTFRGHSDTEVMLHAIEGWGLDESLPKFSGMFAFALVDLKSRELILARDRMGEKPLYYGWQGNTLLFGSELKALRVHPAWQGGVEPGALALLLRHNVIPTPISIHKGILKLPPASLVRFPLDGSSPGTLPEPQRYWCLEDCFTESRAPESFEAASDQLEALLGNVIEDQMVSDVPLGAFLSGGGCTHASPCKPEGENVQYWL
jgi:asparagine synthase (glutamine-hydrolysing)